MQPWTTCSHACASVTKQYIKWYREGRRRSGFA